MQTDMTQVQEYFNCHLQRRQWRQLPLDMQQAAVNMAEYDIAAALGNTTPDTTDLLVFCAVCEQALFLADKRLREESTAALPDAGRLKSETVEGLGRREYYEPAARTETSDSVRATMLAPRAELFLSRLPAYGSRCFSRG